MSSPHRSPALRLRNRETLLRHLFLHAPLSRLDLSQATGLSAGTVTNIVAELLESGVLLEQGNLESEGGRPRVLLTFNPAFRSLLGVDLGETHLQMELFDFTLQRQHSVRLSVTDGRPEAYVALLDQAWQTLAQQSGVTAEQVLGMGIGVPGVVEHDGQVAISAPLWGWQSVPFAEMLRNILPMPFYIDNGAKALSLAEAWLGAGRGAEHLAVALLGTGVGAGIITRNSLYRGATNSAGEWGHTKIVREGRPCRCGGRGCLETCVGAPGILQTWQEMGGTPPPGQDQIAALHAFKYACQAGQAAALRALDETALFLGLGLSNLINLFNPERVILGGWVGLLLADLLLPRLQPHIEASVLPPSRKKLHILSCQFGQDAIATGAACLVLDRFFQGDPRFQPS